MSAPTIEARARELLNELTAHGGRLHHLPPRADGLPSFIANCDPGEDRSRCGAILSDAKTEPGLLAAMLILVATERGAA